MVNVVETITKDPPDVLLTTTALRERGLRPATGEKPAKVEQWKSHSRSGVRHLWRLDQTVEIKRRVSVPVGLDKTPANILMAIWSVNRAAKRRRDAAESSYHSDLHGFAGAHKEAKARYYRLKDRGIAWLAHHGHLTAAYRHSQLVVWLGGGFSFHSTLAPRDAALPETSAELVRMEAKPAGSREMRLVDAVALLEGLASVVTNYDQAQPAWAMPRLAPRDRSYNWDDDEDWEGDQ
jgi:hypothetical protein